MAARQKELTAAAITAVAVLCGALLPRLDQASPAALASQQSPNVATPAPARRIVSLVPALTEILFAIGAGPQVVGVSSYDDFPPQVRSRPRVGALLDPDTERIFSLKPDLVIVYGSQTDLEGQFARTGIRVYEYRHAGIANILKTIRDLGVISGRGSDGARVARDLQAGLDAIGARVRGRPKPRTMLVMGRDAVALRGVFVSGGVGFLHELLEVAGGDDVFADVKREGVQPSSETMLVRAPEVIIEARASAPPSLELIAKERAVWAQLPSIPAVRNGRVYLLYGSYLVSPGPRLVQAAEAFARVLHPEAFTR